MRRWLEVSAQALREAEEQLNVLNVFPVPDSDTGTNLRATLEAGAEASRMIGTGLVGELFRICARHCLEEARGNSGTLFAVMLAGMAEPLAAESRLTVQNLSRALGYGVARVKGALDDPVPGTMLTVVEEAARTAESWPHPEDTRANLAALLDALVDSAQAAVADSSHTLEVLRGTGRVDAGALGALIILDCLALTVRGTAYPGPNHRPYSAWLQVQQEPTPRRRSSRAPEGQPGVEFMCQISMDPLSAASARHRLSEAGDSVIVTAMGPAEGDRIPWKVHVHVPEASVAMGILSEYGRPQQISTESLDSPDAEG